MSAASVIYVQEYAAQDISKKHGKAQTCKNLSEVWVSCLKMEVAMFSQHSSKSVPTSPPIDGCTVFPTFPIFPHLCFLSYILNWTYPRLNPFKILNLRVNHSMRYWSSPSSSSTWTFAKGSHWSIEGKTQLPFSVTHSLALQATLPSWTALHWKLHRISAPCHCADTESLHFTPSCTKMHFCTTPLLYFVNCHV